MPDTKILIEAFGYLGSFLVVISMLMTSVKKLRIVNTIGSVIFMIYAFIIRSYPTALMNFCLVAINIYQLYKLGRKEDHFRLISGHTDIGAVPYLFNYYEDDIRKYFPDADREAVSGCDTAYLVTYDATPAGILIGNLTGEDTVDMLVDYATPAYRDSSVGHFLYKHLPDYGVKRVVFSGKSQGHAEYMKKMGFTKGERGYFKELCDR